MNFKNLIAIILVALWLAACGGNGDSPPPVAPVVIAAAPVADVTISQAGTVTQVTPGETSSLRFDVQCPQDPINFFCKKPVLVGAMRLETSLDIRQLRVLQDGVEIATWTDRATAGSYLMRMLGLMNIWRSGTIQLQYTLAPGAKSPQTATMVLYVVSAEDNKLVIVGGKANTVLVKALPSAAPVLVTSGSAVVARTKADQFAQKTVTFTCQQGVPKCSLDDFTLALNGVAPNTTVYVVAGQWTIPVTVDSNGFFNGTFSFGGLDFYPGQAMTVDVFGIFPNGGYASMYNIETRSGEMPISSLISGGCNAFAYDQYDASVSCIGAADSHDE